MRDMPGQQQKELESSRQLDIHNRTFLLRGHDAKMVNVTAPFQLVCILNFTRTTIALFCINVQLFDNAKAGQPIHISWSLNYSAARHGLPDSVCAGV